MLDVIPVLMLTTVALFWGVTNALMKKGAEGIEKCSTPSTSAFRNFIEELKFLGRNWKYLLSYGANQLGSLIYYVALGYCDLSIAGPLTNTMTFVVTYFADGYFFGQAEGDKNSEKGDKSRAVCRKLGLLCICSGVLICLSS